MNTTDDLTITEEKPVELSAEEINFAKLVAKGYPLTTAYRKAFPAKENLAYNTIRAYASELYANQNILTEVASTKATASRMARLAESRLEEIMVDGSIDSKTNKVAEVSMFMYEQANGKARQTTEVIGKHVLVTYDLSGGTAGDVPKEVLDALADDE